MFKISPWQSCLEADVILADRKTEQILREERWYIIMGYDVMDRQFYKASKFYDKSLFDREVQAIQKRFPLARQKPPKKDL